jgi:hypothetical protein
MQVTTFTKVYPRRKQPIRGLWKRGDRYYAQLKFEDEVTGQKRTRRVPLLNADKEPVSSDAEVRASFEKLKTQRSENALPVLKRTPKFREFTATYFDFIRSDAGKRMKRDSTIDKKESALSKWADHLGDNVIHMKRPISRRRCA